MSQKSLVHLICFLVLAVSGGPSISLEAATALDTDGSGKVELNEIIAFARSHGLDVDAVQSEFASFDRDQDGTLDISELNATLGTGDATRSNAEKVTLRTRSQPSTSEVASHAETRKLSPNEVVAAPQSLQSPPQSMIRVHNQNTQSQTPVESGPAPAATALAENATSDSAPVDVTAAQSMIKALDTDGSGVVEKAEVDAFAKSQGLSAAETAEEFKDLDKNHDGQLDSTEISSTVAQYTSTPAPVPAAVATKPAPTVEATPQAVAAKQAPAIQAAPLSPAAKETPEWPASPATPPKSEATAETGAVTTDALGTPQKSKAPTETGSATNEQQPLATDPEEVVKTLAQNTAQADRTVAQLFALKASNDLAKRDKDIEEASALEQKASALRGQAQKVAADAIESAELAAQKVGRSIMEKALDEAQNLENQAKKVEGRAASINAKAKVAMAQAIKAQSSASKAVEDLVSASQKDLVADSGNEKI